MPANAPSAAGRSSAGTPACGASFASNGPLLAFTLGGQGLGSTLTIERAQRVKFSARLRSLVPLDHAQVVCNGKVVRELPLGQGHLEASASGELSLAASGWCVLRAYSAKAEYPVLDNFVYATTSPVYVSVAGVPARSPEDARYFAAWIEHLSQVTAAYPDWNSPVEKAAVLGRLAAAKAVYERLQ